MISSLWIAKTGLDAQQTNMDVIANNLANVSTNGFKRQRAVFEDLLYQTIRQPGAQSSEQTTLPSGLQIGTGVRPVATERLHSQGNLSQTNNSKDVAIKGQGFFQVLAGADDGAAHGLGVEHHVEDGQAEVAGGQAHQGHGAALVQHAQSLAEGAAGDGGNQNAVGALDLLLDFRHRVGIGPLFTWCIASQLNDSLLRDQQRL